MANQSKKVSKLTHIKMFGEKPELSEQNQKEINSGYPTEYYSDTQNNYNQSSFESRPSVQPIAQKETSAELPKFLQNIQPQHANTYKPKQEQEVVNSADSFENYKEFKPKENNLLSFGYSGSAEKNVNPNSFSSIFNKDHAEQAGVQRVFRKSATFLAIQTILFSLLVIAGINFFSFNFLFVIALAILFVTVTNIFYIILADKSYIWLSLATQAVGLLLFNSFIGQGFNPISLLFTAVILFMSYTAYTEVEKFQLGARLFKISIITGEATRILTMVVTLVLSLGVFNTINSYGSQKFVDEVPLKSSFINAYVFEGVGGIGLNRILIKNAKVYSAGDEKYTFYDFLDDNYRSSGVLESAKDSESVAECKGVALTSPICAEKLRQFRVEKATKWAAERYPSITFPVQTTLTVDRYNQVVQEYYSQLVKNFVSVDDSTEAKSIPIPIPSFIPRTYLIPAIIAIIVFLLLFVARFFLNWIVLLFTTTLWKILEVFHFVNIDVENVEAEVVSI